MFWKERSVEDDVTLRPKAQATLVNINYENFHETMCH